MKVIDASDMIMGRLSSEVAKMLISGEKVVIVNAEKTIVSGRKEDIFAKFKQRVDRADLANPRRGPKYPRRPDMIVKRTIKGMLPKSKRGRDMLKNLKVYMGIPNEIDGKVEKVNIKIPKRGSFTRLEEVSEYLGWKNPIKGGMNGN